MPHKYSISKFLFILFAFLFTIQSAFSQDGFLLQIKGVVKKDGVPVKGATVTVSGDPKSKAKPEKTKKDGTYFLELNFGVKLQTIKFEYPGCIPMFIEVNSTLPAAKQKAFYTYEINPDLLDTNSKDLKYLKYRYPMLKVYFTDNVFKDDLKYTAIFEKGDLEELDYAANPKKKRKAPAETTVVRPKTISARFTTGNDNKPLSATKVTLVNDSGKVIQTFITNSAGRFVFKNIPPDKNYLVHIEEQDTPLLSADTKINMIGKNNVVIESAVKGEDKKFKFKILLKDKNFIGMVEFDDNHFKITGNLLGGTPTLPLSNVMLVLVNDQGIAEQSAKTNLFGSFVFSGVSKDHKFTIKVDGNAVNIPANAKILIAHRNGKEIISTTSDGKGMFKYEFLPTDINTLALMEVDDSDLRLDINGKVLQGGKAATPVNKAKVNVLDNSGNQVQSVTTDKAGKFKIMNLPADANYTISIDEKESKIVPNGSIVIASDEGKPLREHKADKDKKYTFHLKEADMNHLGYYYFDDPWLQVLNAKNRTNKDTILISERTYYGFNDAGISAESKKILDKVIQVMLTVTDVEIELHSYTDAKGDAAFNLKLSQKRAKAAVDYIIAGGIEPKRVTGIGNGETNLVNNCGHDSNCTEEEHALNRRLEFKVIPISK